MPVATCPQPDELLAFMLGKVPDGAASTIASHLDECTACDRTATSLEGMSDSFIAELRRPTGDTAFLGEAAFQDAAGVIAAVGQEPTDAGVDRQRARAAVDLQQIGQYRLLEKIGEGGMGAVYKALHARLEKVVALKVLPPAHTQNAGAVARFEREMKAVGRLDHTNIVRAMDAGEVDGVHYLVMEYVEGVDLSELVRRHGPLPIADACELICQAAVGLEHAHQHGMVHRDIKPSNIIVAVSRRLSAISLPSPADSRQPTADRPTVKILDLGLALLADAHQADGRDLTGSGQMMGTLDYMAPEQVGHSHEVDTRADVYSLGASLYKLLTGEPIYHGPRHQTNLQKLAALAGEAAPRIQSLRADIPNELAAVVHRMIAKDPTERYNSPAEVAAALAPFAREANLARLLDTCSGAEGGLSASAPERPTASGGTSRPSHRAPAPAKELALSTPKSGWPGLIGLVVAASMAGILLAALFIFRTPQGEVIVEIDDAYRDEVSLLVSGRGRRFELKDETGWTINLADGQYDIDLGKSNDNFEVDKQSVTVRRGEAVVVRVTRKPETAAATAKIELRPPAGEAIGQEALVWLAENNAFDPQHVFVDDARQQILPQVKDGHGFSYRIAGGLLKSGTPTVLAVHGDKMFTHQLTPEQAKIMGLEQPIAGFRTGPQKIGKRAAKPQFNLSNLNLDNEAALGEDGRFAGWIDFRRLRPAHDPATKYCVRLIFMFDNATTVIQGISGDLASDRGSLRLDFATADTLPKYSKPTALTMFVELGTQNGSDDMDDFIALSDPISQVITMHPAKPMPDAGL